MDPILTSNLDHTNHRFFEKYSNYQILEHLIGPVDSVEIIVCKKN